MSGLTDFLLARITEDEAVARDALTLPEDVERTRHLDGSRYAPTSIDDPRALPLGRWEMPMTSQLGVSESAAWDEAEPIGGTYFVAEARTAGVRRHIVGHDPARVLAECEAKRRIVESHAVPHKWCAGEVYLDPDAPECDTLRILALPYADHPDYDESWRA